MTLDQIEEHGLILAIQAAHDASLIEQRKAGGPLRGGKLSASLGAHVSGSGGGAGGRARSRERSWSGAGRREMSRVEQDLEAAPLLGGGGDTEGGVNVFITDQKPSAELFLLGRWTPPAFAMLHAHSTHCAVLSAALGMHFLSCGMVSVLSTLIPIWMAIHVNRGGMGYSVKDCALVLSTAGLFILCVHANVAQRVKLSLRAFPVRTFRCVPASRPSASQTHDTS
jgi:hypothetical protein